MKTAMFLFPNGLRKCLTLSYDDGVVEDRRLVEIFNHYQVKGTFHINGGSFGKPNRLTFEEASIIYQGHEISCHSFTHPFLERTPKISMLNQTMEDRKSLEKLAGYPVRGMSYPMGTWNSEVKEVLRSADIVYSRTTKSTGGFGLPDDWLEWHPTCHHREDILAKAETFKTLHHTFALFYVWGHSYEFERNGDKWDIIESFCASISGRDDIWYATNIEIYDYVTALRRLEFTADGEIVRNPSVLSVYLLVDGEIVKINGGETKSL